MIFQWSKKKPKGKWFLVYHLKRDGWFNKLWRKIDMRKIDKIYIHCSDSKWGEREEIERWHLARRFSEIGYHFLITNQFPFYADLKENKPKLDWDGKIQIGRPMEKIGAGVKDDNKTSLHICLVGEKYFTEKQLQNASQLCLYLALKFGLSLGTDILGHYEYWTSKGLEALKSCPNIRMPDFRKMLKMVELDPTFKI